MPQIVCKSKMRRVKLLIYLEIPTQAHTHTPLTGGGVSGQIMLKLLAPLIKNVNETKRQNADNKSLATRATGNWQLGEKTIKTNQIKQAKAQNW